MGLAGLAGAAHLFELPALGDDAPVLASARGRRNCPGWTPCSGVFRRVSGGCRPGLPGVAGAAPTCRAAPLRGHGHPGGLRARAVRARQRPPRSPRCSPTWLTNCVKQRPGQPGPDPGQQVGTSCGIRISDFRTRSETGCRGVGVRRGCAGRAVSRTRLGLHISRQLLGPRAGGSPCDPAHRTNPACTVVLELQAAVVDRLDAPPGRAGGPGMTGSAGAARGCWKAQLFEGLFSHHCRRFTKLFQAPRFAWRCAVHGLRPHQISPGTVLRTSSPGRGPAAGRARGADLEPRARRQWRWGQAASTLSGRCARMAGKVLVVSGRWTALGGGAIAPPGAHRLGAQSRARSRFCWDRASRRLRAAGDAEAET